MKKRFLAVILSMCLLLALVPVQAKAIGGVLSPAERYTEYLVKGGYKTIMEDTVSKSDLEVQSVLVDVDGDGVQEALVHLSDLSTMGPRGYQTHCAVLDLENDEVVIRLQTFYGGGTLGGDMLYLRYDEQQDKNVIILDSTIRDGVNAGAWLQQLMDNQYQVALEVEYNYISLDASWYQERVNKIKAETSLYEVNDYNQLTYWTIDGSYVTKDSYQAQRDRFVYIEEDSPYTMYEGTYNAPIKIKTVPEGYEFDEDSLNFGNYTVSKISKKYFTTIFEDATGKLLYKKYKELGDEGVCYGMSFVTASIYNNLPTITNFVNEKLIGEDEVCQNIRDLETSSKFTVNGEKLSLADYIKYAHLYQLSSAACQEEIDNWADRDGLADMIQQYLDEDLVGLSIALYHYEVLEDGTLREDEDGNPVATGHQVLAIGIEGNDILIDDPNNTSDFERLTLNDDGSWSYSGAWTSDGVNSDNSIFTYETCVEDPYMLLVTGTDTTPGVNVDEDETHVRGMSRVDADKVLLWVDSAEYSLNQNQVIPLNFKNGLGDKKSNLYWVKSGSSVTVSDLSGENSAVYLAGNDDLLSVAAGEGSKVTMTVSDSYTGLILKTKAGETCTLSLENTNSDEEDVVITVSGTVTDGTVLMTKDESGIDYSGMSDVTVTLTKGEEDELSQVVTEEGTSIYVNYAADDAVFEMHIGANDAPVNPFVDVAPGKFYETPVLWAVENEITNGMDDTHFAPDNNCNRGQVVTFLWRAAGSPEPTSANNPFTDVKEGKFYYKAVLWAVEEGITKGTSATTFSPNDNCTRGQVATFLWRTLNEPAASSSTNPFTDVAQGKFYYDAVLWAVEAEVTNGMTATTFAPNNACTRGQIVTFLYRALG